MSLLLLQSYSGYFLSLAFSLAGHLIRGLVKMKNSELIKELQRYDPNYEVTLFIFDADVSLVRINNLTLADDNGNTRIEINGEEI